MQYFLLDSKGKVVAEITSDHILDRIGTISIISWRGANYIYARHLSQYGVAKSFAAFQEAGERVAITNGALEIRTQS